MINNRQQQAGRRRGRGGQGPGQGPRPQGGSGRPDNGNRIDSRARGNAAQLYEKYSALARDAQMQGDRVNIEYYLQFADHYFRVLAEQRGRFDDQQQNPNPHQNQRRPREDGFDGAGDDEFGDEGEPIRAGEQGRGDQGRSDQGRGDQGRGDQGRGDQGRADQFRSDERGQDQGRAESARGSGEQRPRDGQARDGQNGREPRRDGARDDWQRDPRPADRDGYQRDGNRQPRGDHRERDGYRAVEGRGDGNTPANDLAPEPVATFAEAPAAMQTTGAVPPAVAPGEDDAPAPRRRGRPRREAVVAAEEAEPAPAMEVDRLPPALGIAPVSDDGAEKPRRRRGRPPGVKATAAE